MPFDGGEIGTALSKIDQVIVLPATPDRRCEGAEATRDGKHCIVGALRAVRAHDLLHPVVMRVITERPGHRYGIQSFSDSRTMDHALVLKVLHRAPEHVEAGRFVPVTEDQELPPMWQRLPSQLTRLWT